jgi:hypothetical protein
VDVTVAAADDLVPAVNEAASKVIDHAYGTSGNAAVIELSS